MLKRAGSFIQYGLLATLLFYGIISNLGSSQLMTFLSVVVLGIVLGLLCLFYYAGSLTFGQKLASHLGFSALAILIVCLFNGWIHIAWDKVFTWTLIISGLLLLAYLGYRYLTAKKSKVDQEKMTLSQEDQVSSAQEKDFDPATGVVVHHHGDLSSGSRDKDQVVNEPADQVAESPDQAVEPEVNSDHLAGVSNRQKEADQAQLAPDYPLDDTEEDRELVEDLVAEAGQEGHSEDLEKKYSLEDDKQEN